MKMMKEERRKGKDVQERGSRIRTLRVSSGIADLAPLAETPSIQLSILCHCHAVVVHSCNLLHPACNNNNYYSFLVLFPLKEYNIKTKQKILK